MPPVDTGDSENPVATGSRNCGLGFDSGKPSACSSLSWGGQAAPSIQQPQETMTAGQLNASTATQHDSSVLVDTMTTTQTYRMER
eukprot:COSAG02_NODE_801_length_17030_cov_150.308428_18_plen_85_part_00